MKNRTILLCLTQFVVTAWLIWTPIVLGQPTPSNKPTALQPSEEVNKLLAPIREKHKLPALWGAIVKGDASDDQIVSAIGAVGVRKHGEKNAVTIYDRIHVGSCTKAMTATMLAKLVEEGTLTFESTLGDVFPNLREDMHKDFRRVTVWQLLTHTSGCPANGPWSLLGRGNPTKQRRNLVDLLMRSAPLSPPGEKHLYSNAGYAVAGLMGETVASKSWETLMQERLFGPLGMDSAGFGPPSQSRKNQPVGHIRNKGDNQKSKKDGSDDSNNLDQLVAFPLDNPPALGPAGRVHCSLHDWAKFVALHLRAGQFGPTGQAKGNNFKFLEKETMTRLHTPPKGESYAGGWVLAPRPWAGGAALTHSGSNTRWFATVWMAPKRNFAVLSATNVGGDAAAKACDETAGVLIGLATK